MKPTQKLHDAGQSIWLDHITRGLLDTGKLQQYVNELSVTGLTSNPTIFNLAIRNSGGYDVAIRRKVAAGASGEALFFDLAIEDLRGAADLLRPAFEKTKGVDGWVSLEVSPLLAYDTASTLAAAKSLHAKASRSNMLIKIGFDLIFELPAPVPMLLMLHTHPEQAPALRRPERLRVEPDVPVGHFTDGFGNHGVK